MPVFRLTEEVVFPHPSYAEEDGLLAVGGDLSQERLLLSYQHGIFPWFNPEDPILWWAPDPRCVLFPDKIHISRSMKRFIKKEQYQVTFNKNFPKVMETCGSLRADATWITDEMKAAYVELHHHGFAQSVEIWEDDTLVGGLYGVSMGKCFFAESMFSLKQNTSKMAMIALCQKLVAEEYVIIDCQMPSDHLFSMGAEEIPRERFMEILEENT